MAPTALVAGDDPPPGRRASVLQRRALVTLLAALVAGELLLVWAHPRFPSNDGPAHQYSAWVARQLEREPPSPLARWFVLNPARIYPNRLYDQFLVSMPERLAMADAERIGISIYLIALPLAIAGIAHALGRDPWLSACLGVALSMNFILFMGFFNFLWGVVVALAFLICLYRTLEAPTGYRMAASGLLLALTFYAHLVAFGIAVVGAVALQVSARWRRRGLLALVSWLPVALVALLLAAGAERLESRWRWQNEPLERLFAAVGASVASGFGDPERSVALALGVPILVAAFASLAALRRRSSRILLVFAGLLLGLIVLGPTAIGAGGYLDARLMLAFWLVVAMALEPIGPRTRMAGAAVIATVAFAHLLFLEARFREYDEQTATYLSALDRIPAGAALYCRTQVPRARDFEARPMATVQNYYHLALASPSFTHYQAAPLDAAHFPVAYTEAGLKRYRAGHRKKSLPVRELADWAEYVLVWGAGADDLARSASYHELYSNGPLRLYRRTPPAAPPRPPMSVGGDPRAGSAAGGAPRRLSEDDDDLVGPDQTELFAGDPVERRRIVLQALDLALERLDARLGRGDLVDQARFARARLLVVAPALERRHGEREQQAADDDREQRAQRSRARRAGFGGGGHGRGTEPNLGNAARPG